MNYFHLYAEDGFEGAFKSLRSARVAARRGANARGVSYRVYETENGRTGDGQGGLVFEALPKPKKTAR